MGEVHVYMAGGELSAKQLNIVERRGYAMALRKQGASLRQIAEQMREDPDLLERGVLPATYSQTQVANDIAAELSILKRQNLKIAEEYLTLQMERYEELLTGFYQKATNGDLFALQGAMAIMSKQDKLMGTEAPTKFAPTSPDGQHAYEGSGGGVIVYVPENHRDDGTPPDLDGIVGGMGIDGIDPSSPLRVGMDQGGTGGLGQGQSQEHGHIEIPVRIVKRGGRVMNQDIYDGSSSSSPASSPSSSSTTTGGNGSGSVSRGGPPDDPDSDEDGDFDDL